MASSFTTNFGIEKIGSGEQSGAWGTTTNHNLDLLDRIASFKAVGLTGTTHTLTVREASPDAGTENLQDGMFRVIKFTGALGANNTVTVAPNTTTAYFIFINATTDSGSSGPYSVIISQGSGANITIPNGHTAVVFCDGAGSGAAVTDAFASLYVSDALRIGDGTAEDTKIVFDGNAQDFYIGLDDSADDLVIGSGSVVGTTPAVSIDENQAVVFPAAAVTIGDGTAEDTKLVYNGNAKDFYVGLDDSADKLVVGVGSTVGTNGVMTIDDDAVTIGDGAAADTKIVYDGNAKDFYVGLDDSADKFVIGVGSTVGTNSILTMDDDSVTLGDGAEVDSKLVFDGNAQDFYIALDDSADDLVFGQGSTVGSNIAFSIDENQLTNFSHAAIGSTQTANATGSTTLDFQTYQNFILTFTGNVTLANPSTEAVGQSGFIIIIQDGTGSRTLALGTDYETAGGAGLTISTAASAVDVVPYVVKASGSIQLGAAQLAFA
ncbi:hypothetical protein [Marinobacter sp.]|jgi:hypothetical protein|uniref:hypothetical protein n=1 Tax=Marinobacter sp. TaxID=50741 RepID=UPI000C952B9E|nr:hypothetical protein [Marinobacter sp.]MAK52324.1 hypothetical protein [Marinobacter sp.]|tara:strand:- start:134 stop:1606 length:1473 start_codon:yes stop_codon:yes gene_type:complete